MRKLKAYLDQLEAQAALHAKVGAPAHVHFGAEVRLLLALKNIILADMLPRLAA